MPDTKTKDENAFANAHKAQNVVNVSNVSTIANSNENHSIYTYSTNIDTSEDLKRPGFFNPAFRFLTKGDTVRVFQFEGEALTKYYEFIVMNIDSDNRVVTVAIITEKNLAKVIIA